MEELMLKGKFIVLGVSGSIAAYKSASLASLLIKAGCDVQVIMTENAAKLISPITFETLTGRKCLTDTFDRNFEHKVEHISIAKRADLFMIAPATANVIAKVANGLADDMLTTTFLACKCPKIISPAMNTQMLENPVTQDNLEKCRHYGIKVVESAEGHLACGDSGKGKMPEPDVLFSWIENEVSFEKDLAGKKILVTAGPTREALDPVRYITNHSSGKMGYAIAKVAAARGADVTLISGPVNLPELPFVRTVKITSAAEMAKEVLSRFSESDAIIKAAAVADYRPKTTSDQKIKKSGDSLSLEMERTRDILKSLGEMKAGAEKNQRIPVLCGFSMETENLIENSRAKLLKKNLDMIVANSLRVQGAGFGGDTNVVTIITRDGEKKLPLLSKEEVAVEILDEVKVRVEK